MTEECDENQRIAEIILKGMMTDRQFIYDYIYNKGDAYEYGLVANLPDDWQRNKVIFDEVLEKLAEIALMPGINSALTALREAGYEVRRATE